jgi:hypothetical protein
MRRALLLTMLAGLLLPAAALGSGASVIADCTDNGKIDSSHSQADYNSARGNRPSDVDEYTDCRSIIAAARRNNPGSGSGSGSGGSGSSGFTGGGTVDTGSVPSAGAGAVPKTPSVAAAPVVPPGPPIIPGAARIASGTPNHSIPGPLLVTLILLGASALAAMLARGRERGLKAPAPALRLFDRAFPRRA